MSERLLILKNAYKKIDGMVLSFGLPQYTDEMVEQDFDRVIGIDLLDAQREMKISDIDSIPSMSEVELQLENRVVYYALRRFRTSASIFFKFSTAVDGKTVDKSMIPKMLNQIISEYNSEYLRWKRTYTNIGQLWNRGDIGANQT